MSYFEPTGETCPETGRPIGYQVTPGIKNASDESEPDYRSGPTCEASWCTIHGDA